MKPRAARQWQIRQRGGACIFDCGIRRCEAVCGGPWWHREKLRSTLSTLPTQLGQPSRSTDSTDSTGTSDGCVFHCWEDVEKERAVVESSSHQDKDLDRVISTTKKRRSSNRCLLSIKNCLRRITIENHWDTNPKFNRPVADCWTAHHATPLVLSLPAANCCQSTCHISWKPNFPGIGFGPDSHRQNNSSQTAGSLPVRPKWSVRFESSAKNHPEHLRNMVCYIWTFCLWFLSVSLSTFVSDSQHKEQTLEGEDQTTQGISNTPKEKQQRSSRHRHHFSTWACVDGRDMY